MIPTIRRRGAPRALLASGVVGLTAVAAYSPIQITDRVIVAGRVMAAQEWVITRESSGAVATTLRDYRTGAVDATLAAEPARGDAVRFHLGPAVEGRTVAAGDTVGGFVSEEAALRLTALAGDVELARAELSMSQAGEKDELIEVARQETIRAQASLEFAQRAAERQSALYQRGIIAERELEEAESELRVATAERAAAQALLDAARSGARDEQVALAQARLDALEREATTLRARLQMSDLVAPISGLVYSVMSPDTLLMVADTSSYTVVLPVQWSDRERVKPGQDVVLRITEWGEQPRGRILELRESSARASGQAYLVATAEVYEGKEALTPGLLVQGSIEAARLSIPDYARRVVGDFLHW
ncbi:MAG: HlyD family efflux transporter periplasmic adaptor subunit [Longimicrobiales bacterium]